MLILIFVIIIISIFIFLTGIGNKKFNEATLNQTINVSVAEDSNQNLKVHTPEQFGANGFDNKVDTTALQEAINHSDVLILKSGAQYIIDKPLIVDNSIKIESKEEAVIKQIKKQSALIFENKPIKSTSVKESISSNEPYIVLSDTNGIEIGTIIHLQSNKLWHLENRGYLKKGELQKVSKIDGNKVYFDNPTADEYLVGKREHVSATVYPNKTLELKNIIFTHPRPYETIMLDINYTTDTIIENVSVNNSKRIGILLNSTYQTKVNNVNINLGTTKDITSGYGIQDYGGTETIINNSIFRRVRRGVDFSGLTPSRYGVVTNSKAFGYNPGVLATGNSGFGSHSTAEYITFKNNYVENFNYAFLVRGNQIKIEGNYLSGSSKGFAAITYANNVEVLNNTYNHNGKGSLESFIRLSKVYRGSLITKDNLINGIDIPLIRGDVGQLKSLILQGNDINIDGK